MKFYHTILLILCYAASTSAQDYPFSLPDSLTATVNITSGTESRLSDKMLSVNIGWDTGLFGLDGYDSPNAKSFMRKFRPASIRWTHGVWSNWYDWEADKPLHRDDYDFGDFDDIIEGNARFDWTFGFRGMKELHDEQGFDVLWTFSMLYDDATDKAVRRVRDRDSKGFDVSHVEMGNEHFWRDQRSRRLETPEQYLAACEEMSAALKVEKPDIKLSITTSWRRGEGTGTSAIDHTDYNNIIKGDGSHYDAVTLHRYIHEGRDADVLSAENISALLTSPITLAADAAFVLDGAAAGKEVWLTEWGVSGGYRAASYLGMADAYLYLFDNRDVFKYTNWFQINGTNNFFIQTTENGQYVQKKRGFGVVYDMLDRSFRDSDLLDTDVTTAELVPGSKAISARAATKEGITTVFAVNKTPQATVFDLSMDGTVYAGEFQHDAFAFDNLEQDSIYAYEDQAFVRINSGTGTITLPPYSINMITLSAEVDDAIGQMPYADTITLPGTIQAENFDLGGQRISYYDLDLMNLGGADFRTTEDVDIVALNDTNFAVATTADEWMEYTVFVPVAGTYDFNIFYSGADAGAKIGAELWDTLSLFGGIALMPTGSDADFQSLSRTNVRLPIGTHTLRINADGGSFNLDRIEVTQVQTPYAETNRIPGTLEAERFDLGGQEVSYFDKSTGNGGNADFRIAEDVDLSVATDGSVVVSGNQFGEWQEFTVEVKNAANYNFNFSYAGGGNGKMKVERIGFGLIIPSIDLPSTGGFSNPGAATAESIFLPAGEHVLRFQTTSGGFNLDKITILEDVEQLAFNGPHIIPGVIEAEDYDVGGLGISYNDSELGNQNGAYRDDDVDLSTVNAGDSTNFAVVNVVTGEWLEYTVQVAETGTYTIDLDYASGRGDGGIIGFELPDKDDGALVAGTPIPRTGPWSTYVKLRLGDTIALTQGEHVLRVNIVRAAFNLDRITFTNTLTATQVPYADAIPLPGTIEAENFDTGGEGLSYSDTDPENKGDADFRTDEAVEIDSLAGGGLGVVGDADGEWQEFTVVVSEAGPYDFTFNYSAVGDDARVSVERDDFGAMTPEIPFPATGSVDSFRVVTQDSVDLPLGTYVIRINTVSSGFTLDKVTVVSSIRQAPYAGVIAIPGVLEAENYDDGAQGLSYSDSDPENRNGVYRMDGVDVGEANGGFIIGWNVGGEWQEYTVNIAETAFYDLNFHYSSGRVGGGVIGLEFPDEENGDLVPEFELPQTEGWGSYDTLQLDSVFLEAGVRVLRVNVVRVGYNFDRIVFTQSGTTSITGAPRLELLKVFPNPSADGRFFLNKVEEWKAYSVYGQLVAQGKGMEIDLSQMAAGTYLIRTEKKLGKVISR